MHLKTLHGILFPRTQRAPCDFIFKRVSELEAGNSNYECYTCICTNEYLCSISGAVSKTHEMCAADARDTSSIPTFVKLVQLLFPSHTRSERHLFSIKI